MDDNEFKHVVQAEAAKTLRTLLRCTAALLLAYIVKELVLISVR